VIVVLGRPGLSRPTAPAGALAADVLHGLAAEIALAAVRAGARVELVGSIGDDPDGDLVAVLLGQAGIGHAALLRDPAGHTPVDGRTTGDADGPPPRLDAGDVQLGLGYLADIKVLVLTEQLPADAEAALLDAVGFHGAPLIVTVPPGGAVTSELAETATVLEAPRDATAPFAEMVGRYAAALDSGSDAASAFAEASTATGWERAPA
jgi:ribokinase